jgi:hypothetical protein
MLRVQGMSSKVIGRHGGFIPVINMWGSGDNVARAKRPIDKRVSA